jgi:N6-adenosine-specific RNA methylase IME4
MPRTISIEQHAVFATLADGTQIRYYEVRSENDPRYKHLPLKGLVSTAFTVYTRQYTTEVAAAKAVLKPLGYYAKTGGWVYYQHQGCERTLTQGWWAAARITGHFVSRLQGEKGYRAVVTTALLVKVEKVDA